MTIWLIYTCTLLPYLSSQFIKCWPTLLFDTQFLLNQSTNWLENLVFAKVFSTHTETNDEKLNLWLLFVENTRRTFNLLIMKCQFRRSIFPFSVISRFSHCYTTFFSHLFCVPFLFFRNFPPTVVRFASLLMMRLLLLFSHPRSVVRKSHLKWNCTLCEERRV